MHSGFGVPYRGLSQHRPAYRPSFGDRNRDWDRDRHGRDRFYGYASPGWGYIYPYPYVIDPGFFDWDDSGDNGQDQNATTSEYAPYADYGEPYPQEPQEPYNEPPPYPQSPYPQQPYQPESAPNAARPPSAPSFEESLTVIFKNGRAPQTIRNYMMSTKELTDMDPHHFERIPLGEIDIAATAKLNRARGVNFELPTAVRD